jgi:hypothetical protein
VGNDGCVNKRRGEESERGEKETKPEIKRIIGGHVTVKRVTRSGDPRITHVTPRLYLTPNDQPSYDWLRQFGPPDMNGNGNLNQAISGICSPCTLSALSCSTSFQSSSITVSSSSRSDMRQSWVVRSQRFKGCGSGQDGSRPSMALGRSEGRREGEKEGAELSREEPEEVEGESGGVGCRSLAWGKGQAMGHLKGRGAGEGRRKGSRYRNR